MKLLDYSRISDLQEELAAGHPEKAEPVYEQHRCGFEERFEARSEKLEEVGPGGGGRS
jgi:hypothetical protein